LESEILGPCAGAALYKIEAIKDIMIDKEKKKIKKYPIFQ